MATNLTAVVDGNTLKVSGQAATTTSYSQVQINKIYSSVEIEDNGSVGVLVPIQGEASGTQNINASAVTGAGVSIYSYAGSSQFRSLTGSAQGDYIYAGGQSNDKLYGGTGNDTLHAGEGNDHLFGGWGSDRLYGDSGNDTLFGSYGNDTIDGGDGVDTIVFMGQRSEYQIDIVDGLYQISHTGGTRSDGIDSFANVENLQFTDQTMIIDELFWA